MSDRERRSWAYLSRVAEPPCAELAQLVERVGPIEAADLVKRARVSKELAKRTAARRDIDCAAADLELVDRLGGRLVVPGDEEWPVLMLHDLTGLGVPPLLLWALGPEQLADVSTRSCAVVGTRAATAYGEHVTADLATGLVERDVSVVSGAAYGIDGTAHRAVLSADGQTVAVLAGGLDVPYPSGHSALLHRISKQGLLVSEYPPGIRPARYRFLTRNRLVAALGCATVVVEAGLRSGAANTAGWAEKLGRHVCAVPGPVTSSASAGCHALVRSGATLVTRAAEIVEIVGRMGEFADEPAHPVTPLDALTDQQKCVYEALPARGSRSVDEIAIAAGLPPTQVLGPLASLELADLVIRDGGRWKLAKR